MKTTQMQIVKEILESGKSITSMDAFELGITRLSAIIFNLRKLGMIISTEDKVTVTRYGNVCTYASYKLVKENETNESN